MHDDHELVEHRLERVLGERIWTSVHPVSVPLRVSRWDVPEEPVPVKEALRASYRSAAVGDPWGPPWGTTWFRFTGTVPHAWAGRRVEAVIDLGFDPGQPGFSAEGLVHDPSGTVLKGLNPRNLWVRAASPAAGGEEVDFYVEAAANPLILGPAGFRPTSLGDPAAINGAPQYRLARADLAVFDEEVWGLSLDLEVLSGLMHRLPAQSPRRWEILRAVAACLDRLDPGDVPGTAAAARAPLAPVLAAPAERSAHRLSAVGHAHIDSAWLWPLRETVRKVARTAANVTALMDEHPGLVFAMSQAQQLAWLRDHHPGVFDRVRARVAEGRFVPVGGMWVESDTNMPGSEALARQFSFGKRFFREELGVDTREVWLPDSFGYSAALPQLVKLSGSRWFLTQKISWSQTNTFPHHTFWWEGIDGTRVFTHFPPIDTYNAELTGHELGHAADNFREKGRATRSLAPFGHGDGGGGPTREMLGRADRLADLEGSPRVRLERPQDFFAAAEAEYPDAPVWLGELYLELHRGTYTSQAATKQGNRRSEHLLREAELWAATAAVATGADYPYDRLDDLWRRVLLNQFHDILPGSSIAWVHREAARSYAEIAEELTGIIESAQAALGGGPDAGTGEGPPGEVVFNPCPHERDGVPALGAAIRAVPTADPEVTAVPDGDGHVLDNGLLRVTVDGRGLITSVVDLGNGREAIAPGSAGNLLQLHRDLPNAWDAWDIDPFYRGNVTDLVAAEEISVVSAGPGKASVSVRRSFGSSSVVQVLSLRRGARRLDVTTEVDWHERERILKVAFPLDVRADSAASEIQFGHVHRPTHTNTSWDAAKFETCAHRWIHVAEPGYGHAVVNDSTYGHDVTRDVRGDGGTTTTVRLSLLRAPRFPDPETDQGRHRFGYALVPGAGIDDAVREGYRINLPERGLLGGSPVAPLVEADGAGVVVESVKLADDRSGDVVVRLYEALGARTSGTLTASFPVDRAVAVDLLEAPLDDAPPVDSGHLPAVAFRLRPFQILTLRLTRA
ncbi:alpha-mannosidase [Nocardiopsis sediminis]|uniref:Alpha-mannosidase n=1 Tax=Nocardiopsis sediminis TaxID=1778267 RepID=A0ABV8FSE3_9ACTN